MLTEIKRYYNKTAMQPDKFKALSESEVPESWRRIFYKEYPRLPAQPLAPRELQAKLADLLISRESYREFRDASISFENFSTILHYSAGLKKEFEENSSERRYYPSAGARYPVEIYAVANNILNIKRGLYHFNVKNDTIEMLLERDLKEEVENLLGSKMGREAGLILFLTGVLSRTEVKYGANAYRFALLEAGHIGQNISLIAEDLKVGCCALGGFDNKRLVKLLDIGGSEIPLYAFALGSKT